MDNLVAWLNRIDDLTFGSIVHVGAGSGAVLEHYADLPAARRPRQVVLIEGDPDLARSLERAAGVHAWARVLPTPVGPQGGQIHWNRFNLPMLNGPLDATALTAFYPRLRRVQTTTVRCEALSDVLCSLNLTPDTDARRVHALVLDVPGQESGLIAALSPDLLRHFNAIVLRGCRNVLPPSGQVAEAALALVTRQHFAPVAKEDERDTIWPVALMCFDRRGHELAQLRRQLAQMDTALKERDRLSGELQSLAQAKSVAEKLAAERLVQMDTALKERDRLSGELQSLAQAKSAAEKLAAERLAKTVEQDDRTRQLETQLAEASTRLELLQQEVLKAEGQLALMKELLLKEHSL